MVVVRGPTSELSQLDSTQSRGDSSLRSLDALIARAQSAAKARAAGFRWDPLGEATAVDRQLPRDRSRPLHVLVSDRESTLFQDLHDPRVRVFGPAARDTPPPDVVVLTRADRLELDKSSRDVPASAWARVASGEARFVYDASGEGNPHMATRTAVLHDFLRSRGVALINAVYVTQDRGYPGPYTEHCAALGLGAQRMQVWIYDRFIQRTFAALHDNGEEIFQERLARYASAPRHRERRFICLNQTVRPIRALLLLKLMHEGLWDRGFISVGPVRRIGSGREATQEEYLQRLRKLRGFRDIVDEVAPLLDRLEALAPTYLDGNATLADPRARFIPAAFPEYRQSWFTVVTETHFSDRLHRITEKPFKPVLNFHPLIFLSSVGSLRLLRAYGFETCAGFFDEAYDEVEDPRRRFDMVFDQIVRISRADEDELARRDAAVAEAVVFNAYWGLTQLPKLFRAHIDPMLVDLLVEFMDRSPPPSTT